MKVSELKQLLASMPDELDVWFETTQEEYNICCVQITGASSKYENTLGVSLYSLECCGEDHETIYGPRKGKAIK